MRPPRLRGQLAPFLILVAFPAMGAAQPVAGGSPSDATSLEQGIYTQEQARAGGRDFTTICTACHGDFDLLSPILSMKWTGRTLRELYERIRNTMPEDRPGSLSDAQATQLVAYLLSRQGFPPGDRPLEPDVAALAELVIHPPANPQP